MALPPSAPRVAALLVVALATAGALAPAPAEERALERTARAEAAVALDGPIDACADLSLEALTRVALGARLACGTPERNDAGAPEDRAPGAGANGTPEAPRDGRGLFDGWRNRSAPRADTPREGPADAEGVDGPERREPEGAREGAGEPGAGADARCGSACAELDASARGVRVLPQPADAPGLLARAIAAVVAYLGAG